MLIPQDESVLSAELAAALAQLVEDWSHNDAGALARRELPAARELLLDVLQALVQYNRDGNLDLHDVASVLQGAKALRLQDYVCQEPDWVEHIARRLWVTSWSIGPAELPVRRLFYTLVLGPGMELSPEKLTYITQTLHEQCGQPADLEVLFGMGEDTQLGPRVRVLLIAALS